MKRLFVLAVMAATAMPLPAAAQETIVVTGSRQDRSATNAYFARNNEPSAIGVTRRADYFVTPLYVSSDSRDVDLRHEELYAMLGQLLDRAKAEDIDIVAGRYKLSPVTRDTMGELDKIAGSRPDTSRVLVYARIPLAQAGGSVSETAERIAAFVKAVPVTGRSFIDVGTTGLAIDDPEQYRGAVVKHIAEESTRYAAMFGSGYGVEITGLAGDLYWQQAGETEIFLYIEHAFTIKPH